MQGRGVIPIHSKSHQLVAYAARSIQGEEPKYRFPPGFHTSIEVAAGGVHFGKKHPAVA
jgi:hypothetical protein